MVATDINVYILFSVLFLPHYISSTFNRKNHTFHTFGVLKYKTHEDTKE